MNRQMVAGLKSIGAVRGRWGLVGVLIFWLTAVGPVAAQSSATKFSEYEIKAVFLFNFMQFVEWPAAVSTSAAAPFVIGVLGDDPFGTTLDATIRGETIRDRPLTVRRGRDVADLKDCHLIFICRDQADKLGDILGSLHGSAALTVSDIESFCRHGGMIGLLTEGKRIQFEINQKEAEKSKLKISSKLLRLGRLTEE